MLFLASAVHAVPSVWRARPSHFPCLDNLTYPNNDHSDTTYYMPGIVYSKHYIYYLYEGGTIIISFLQIKKLGHCEVK